MFKYFFSFLFIIFIPQIALTQNITHTVDSFYVDEGSKSDIGLSLNIYNNDFFFGGFYQLEPSGLNGLYFFTSFHIRPFAKRVSYRESKDTYYIFKENQFQFYFGTGYTFNLIKDLSLQTSISINPIGSNFRGSNKKSSKLIAPVLDIGIGGSTSSNQKSQRGFNWQIGYRYRNDSVDRHGIYIKFYYPLFQ